MPWKVAFSIIAMGLIGAGTAAAQDGPSGYEQAYGIGYGQAEQPFKAGTRNADGSRLVVGGRIIEAGSTLPLGLGMGGEGPAGIEHATAIGNQLNVVVEGSFNTVIVDATQINNGDQTAIVKNGEK